ncbi:Phosphatidylglycerophosphatase B [Leminorella richardii]|uniref:undecaprenyl-diphosphate phosphatase n=1 Tax=Leminorella richardii TaxID=158841 RepID=A0A2X4XV68_9GAMM|nr:phosphatidylglycerophosphatase B [Leminorella richardii]SQI40574.1 Phosphatidylglycerophosphatase B [Leminorella richardii]
MLSCLTARLAAGVLLLLIVPLAVLVTGWQWSPGGAEAFLLPMFWLTETASSPWGAITSVILAIWFIGRLSLSWRRAIAMTALLAVTIVGGQAIKSAVKETVQEPRPYVLWMANQYPIDAREFYAQSRKDRVKVIKQHLSEEPEVPRWLSKHWQRETGYAFPSGHTLFTATWALLGVGLLLPRRRYLSVAVLTAWAIAVEGSRLMLGMHWPLDLITSILLGGILAFGACWLAEKKILLSTQAHE